MVPLSDVDVRIRGEAAVAADAAFLLARYGARVDAASSPGPASILMTGPGCRYPAQARMTATVPTCPGLPAGVPARAAAGLLATAALAATRAGGSMAVDAESVAVLVLQPLVLAAWYSAPAPGRVAPLRVGSSWVAAELGAPGDAELFQSLRALEAGADAQALSRQAQRWRIPVVPYRRTRARAGVEQLPSSPTREPEAQLPAAAAAPLDGVRVVDVTAMWAGPLCTWLLTTLGASVLTVESEARPDGMRAPYGGGIYPGGHVVPGADGRSAMFVALARGKERVALDLRRDADRATFARACEQADLCIDSLSHRARADLGLDGLLAGSRAPAEVRLPAFAAGPQRDWVAYGTQIHAVSGLAWPAGSPDPIPAATAYADALGGILAALAAVVALHLTARRAAPALTAALADAVVGLAPDGDAGALLRADPGARVAELTSGGRARFVELEVAGTRLRHPASPFLPSRSDRRQELGG